MEYFGDEVDYDGEVCTEAVISMPELIKDPEKGLDAIANKIAETFRMELMDFLCDTDTILDNETAFLFTVHVGFNMEGENVDDKTATDSSR